MLHLRVKPFIFGAKDWSDEVRPFFHMHPQNIDEIAVVASDHNTIYAYQLLELDQFTLGAS